MTDLAPAATSGAPAATPATPTATPAATGLSGAGALAADATPPAGTAPVPGLSDAGKTPAATPPGTQPNPAQTAPESYADWKLPEGVTIEGTRNDQFKTIARELGLSQEGAQKMVTLYSDAQVAAHTAMRDLFDQIKMAQL